MKNFKIPVSWEMCGTINIQAETLEEALKEAEENYDSLPLPTNGNYIDGSYEIDKDLAEVYN